jgi:hypothetical protein
MSCASKPKCNRLEIIEQSHTVEIRSSKQPHRNLYHKQQATAGFLKLFILANIICYVNLRDHPFLPASDKYSPAHCYVFLLDSTVIA